MRKLRIFEYSKCSSCRKALQFLDRNRITYEKVPIVERPPSRADLKRMLPFVDGNVRRLFNTSGEVYRKLGLAKKLPQLSESEALALLAGEGKLIKRPFLVSDSVGLVGFEEAAWRQALLG